MKTLKYIFLLMLASVGFTACYDDEGNYTYLSDEEAGEIKIDTIGIANHNALYTLNPGDLVEMEPNVSYQYMENLRYRWLALPLTNYSYQPEQVGNALVYPPADTISYEKKLHWVVDLEPGVYRFYYLVEDSVRGMKAYFQFGNYGTINSEGLLTGLYMLSEYDGETDIDIYTSALITMLRLNSEGLTTMDTWNEMFYSVPEVFDPQDCYFTNNADFLINDGKLHVLYTNQTNDRKFSAPISGNYVAAPFLAHKTRNSYSSVTGAINADQIIYDTESHAFRPYFSAASSLSSFRSTGGDAYLDANHMTVDPIAIFNGYAERTYCITQEEGTYYLYRFNFYDRVDNGDLSADGSRSKLDLSGCTGIAQAKLFAANNYGHAFYYATDNAVYSFSPSSGGTTSTTLYECEPGETVTALYTWNSSGWPTAGCILWAAVWNENTREGKLLEYEIDANAGTPISSNLPMFAPDHTNPYVTTGWGKIVSMTCADTE